MYFSRLKRSKLGDAIASEVAASLGSSFRPDTLPRDGELLLTSYFEDIQTGLHPQFESVRFAEFTRSRLNAYASEFDAGHPYIHIDQHLDRWLLLAFQIVSIRAFIQLGDLNRTASNVLLKTTLEMAFDQSAFSRLKEDSIHLFTDFSDCLRFAHHLSVGALVFVCCHELAHHAHSDLNANQSHEIEFAADLEGFRMAHRVMNSERPYRLLRPTDFGLAGIYVLFSLWDMVERLSAQHSGRNRRQHSTSHPWASDRLNRILPMLMGSPDTARFVDGYGAAIEGFRSDLGLDEIA